MFGIRAASVTAFVKYVLYFVSLSEISLDLLDVKIISSGPVVTGESVNTEVLYKVEYESQMISAITTQTITTEVLNEKLVTVTNPQVRVTQVSFLFIIFCCRSHIELFGSLSLNPEIK